MAARHFYINPQFTRAVRTCGRSAEELAAFSGFPHASQVTAAVGRPVLAVTPKMLARLSRLAAEACFDGPLFLGECEGIRLDDFDADALPKPVLR